MDMYEDVPIILDPHGNATAQTVREITERMQVLSLTDPEAFTRQTITKWDAQADCEQILASLETSRLRKRQQATTRSPYLAQGKTLRRRHHQEGDEARGETQPTTIAQLMGWGDDHVPAEQSASPIVPARRDEEPPVLDADDVPTTVASDVVVEFGGDAGDVGISSPASDTRLFGDSLQLNAERELDEFVSDAISRLDVCAPRAMTLEMLLTMAKNEWYERRVEKEPDVDRTTLRLPQGDFARKNIIVNFVKHELVFPRYDGVVSQINAFAPLASSAAIERGYARWRLAVIDKLSEAFPVLATAANAQRLRRYDSRIGELVSIAAE